MPSADPPTFDPDDPRLTAYVLGELTPEEREAVEAALQCDPTLRERVAVIAALTQDLTAALADEPVLTAAPPVHAPAERPRAPVARFPYFAIGGLAAAGFAVLVALSPESAPPEPAYPVHRYEVQLGPTAESGPAPRWAAVPPAGEEPFVTAAEHPVSSFPMGVGGDTYDTVRTALLQGQRPPASAVRIEELVNALPYDYAAVASSDTSPVAVALEVAATPWATAHRLVRIGLEGRATSPDDDALAAANLRIQVRFNPERVHAYRLLGYDRPVAAATAREGEGRGESLAAGATVTALYEVVPVGAGSSAPDQPDGAAPAPGSARGDEPAPELLTVRLDYTRPADGARTSGEYPLRDAYAPFGDASPDFRLAASAAAFGLVLGDAPHRGTATLPAVLEWADQAHGADAAGRRAEFVDLVRRAIVVTGS